MKFIIVGLHSSGKQETGDILRSMDVSVGRLFTNLDEESPSIYNCNKYELFDTQIVNELFENDSYVFIHDLETKIGFVNYKTYEGLTKWEYEQNDVHILSPNQLLAIPPSKLRGEDIYYVWLDNTRENRMSYYISHDRTYSFGFQETLETQDMEAFVKKIYQLGPRVLYFTNEQPERIATIIYACLKHPDLLPIFLKNYNG